MRKTGDIVSVNGRGKKLLFDPDAVEAWIKKQQSPPILTVTNPAKTRRLEEKAFEQRQAAAKAALERHAVGRKPK